MPPALIVLRVGSGGWFPLPLPLFLVWPFIAIAGLMLVICRPFVREESRADLGIDAGLQMLSIFCHLSGVRIEVCSKDGTDIRIQIV